MPGLPDAMYWYNPVDGERIDRDRWELLHVGPGGTDVLATVRRRQGGEADVSVKMVGSFVVPPAVTLPIAQAFEVAVEFARRSSR